jgi:hypothetical protein
MISEYQQDVDNYRRMLDYLRRYVENAPERIKPIIQRQIVVCEKYQRSVERLLDESAAYISAIEMKLPKKQSWTGGTMKRLRWENPELARTLSIHRAMELNPDDF